jgi:hypothetical protein
MAVVQGMQRQGVLITVLLDNLLIAVAAVGAAQAPQVRQVVQVAVLEVEAPEALRAAFSKTDLLGPVQTSAMLLAAVGEADTKAILPLKVEVVAVGDEGLVLRETRETREIRETREQVIPQIACR